MNMETKHLTYSLALKSLDAEGHFAGYASVFDVVDSQKDIILRGAFRRTLQARAQEVKFLWQHDFSEPIGVFSVIREDAKGLYVEGQLLLDVRRAEEAYALLKAGALEGLSIGYTVKEFEYDAKSGVRLLKDVELWEVSLVTFPSNRAATVTYVKGHAPVPQTVREFEQFLCESGFSRRRAKQITGKGFMPEIDAGEAKMWRESRQSGEAIRLMDSLERAIFSLVN